MRKNVLRLVGGGLVFAGMLGVGLAEQPPAVLPPPKPIEEPRKLRTELEALAAERESTAKELAEPSGLAVERAKLRGQLTELLKRIGEKKAVPPMPPATLPKPKEPTPLPFTFEPATDATDVLGKAQNLYRKGDVEAALAAFRQINPDTLAREDRAFVNYMTACCYRKKGKLAEAGNLYREIADKKDDPFIAEYAVWQLATMQSIQELESNLEQLRSRRKSK